MVRISTIITALVAAGIGCCENGVLAHSGGIARRDRCVLKVFRRLGLHKYEVTSPKILRSILKNDMFLDDLPVVQELMADRLTKRKPLAPMLAKIRKGVARKHNLTAEFLCEALDRGLIPKVREKHHKSVIKRAVHHTYLLELITKEMGEDWEFMVKVQNHLLAKREAFGMPSGFADFVLAIYQMTGDLFEPIKTKSMDWVFSEYETIRKRGTITPQEIDARQNGLTFNIMEACIAENLNGFVDNAKAGVALAVNPPKTLSVVGDSNFIEYELSQEWVSLYESWNLAFCTGNVPYLNLLYPELLIPSVINAKPDEYLFYRALALWVSINFFLFASVAQKTDYAIPNAAELAQLWGFVNHEYAEKFVLDTKGVELSNFDYMLGMTYEMLWAQLKVLLTASGVITPEEEQQFTDLLGQMH